MAAYTLGVMSPKSAHTAKDRKDTRTPEQKTALRELVAKLKTEYPNITIHGHNEFANKACPCFNVKTEL
ncbi:MAG: hypothetical protein E7G33_15850 [Bacteroides sp.]|nr:hypothetical protein [Bacteroides sp.]